MLVILLIYRFASCAWLSSLPWFIQHKLLCQFYNMPVKHICVFMSVAYLSPFKPRTYVAFLMSVLHNVLMLRIYMHHLCTYNIISRACIHIYTLIFVYIWYLFFTFLVFTKYNNISILLPFELQVLLLHLNYKVRVILLIPYKIVYVRAYKLCVASRGRRNAHRVTARKRHFLHSGTSWGNLHS